MAFHKSLNLLTTKKVIDYSRGNLDLKKMKFLDC